jgi:Ner family transcriptional regulator
MQMTNKDARWDRAGIIAEVHRRGMTLTGIAEAAGLYASACRQGIGGGSRAGAQAIADALDIPFETLFPTSYLRGRHHKQQSNRNGSCNTSAIAASAADSERVA